MLKVGYARQAVIPDEPVPLAGFGNEKKRFHTAITHPIYVTAIAITDSDDTTILMASLDLCFCPYYDDLPYIAQQVGVPADRIYLSATHTHGGPSIDKSVTEKFPAAQRYSDKYLAALIQVLKEALADRKPADMYTGSIETKNMNFVRHYKVTDPADGHICYGGDVFPPPADCTYLEHATAVDPTMHILKFARQGGKDIVIANYRAHAVMDTDGNCYNLSASYIGPFRKALEAATGCNAAFFQGACGNTKPLSRFPHESNFTETVSYGMALAAWCVQGLETCMTQIPAGKIKTRQEKHIGKINHTMDHLAPIGKKLQEEFEEHFDPTKSRQDGKPYGIRSIIHARIIWKNSQRTDKEDGWMILNAVSIGEHFAFVTFPGEMFDTLSVRMEENSPFDTTMMLGYCYHHVGYLPSMAAWKYTSYETDTTRFTPGAGEEIADKQIEMLNALKNQ